ncbi:MAG: lipopolysaccharide transport periplasmic protein LptA [Methylotetracoccus sp.]|jgi:lipopolysaccharide export system protein LptA|nr:lipopolysaccharide transport periplasmic protein LptA [Methylotetracoccus sp.]
MGKTMTAAKVLASGFGVLAAVLSVSTRALDSDSREPIYIEADRATYDENTGETVYIGNVQATQGSLVVNSDQMTVYQKDGVTQKVVATGKPVRLKQTPEGGGDDMTGTSARAEYFPEEGLLILLDKAVVIQGKITTESDRIEYDSAKGLAKAGSANSNTKRVHVTIQPK